MNRRSCSCLYLEEVAVDAGHEVYVEVDNSILLIVSDPQVIFDQ